MTGIVDAIAILLASRTGAAKRDCVDAVESLGKRQTTLGRLRVQIEAAPGWPNAPAIGEVLFELANALRERGIDTPRHPCVDCGQDLPIKAITDGNGYCRGCSWRLRKSCPTGRHSMPSFSRRCAECDDEHWTATIVRAIESASTAQQGADLASAAISEVLRTRGARRIVAQWLDVGGNLTAEPADAGSHNVQKLRSWLAGHGIGEEPTCASCGQPRELRYLTEAGRICTSCFQRDNVDICVDCRKLRPVAWRDDAGRPWCGSCRLRHPDVAAKCSCCGKIGPVAVRTPEIVGHCCYETARVQCAGCDQVRPVWAWRDAGPHCRRCFKLPIAECRRCGELRPVQAGPREGRRGWCLRCVELPLVPDSSLNIEGKCADCGRRRKINAYLPDGPRCSTCYLLALDRRGPCATCHEPRRLFFWPGRCATCLNLDFGHVCTVCGLEARIYANGACVRCSLNAAVARDVATLGPVGEVLASRLWASASPLATLRWLRIGSGWQLLAPLIRDREAITHASLDKLYEPGGDLMTSVRHDIEYARALLVAAGQLEPRDETAIRFNRWSDELLERVTTAQDRWLIRRFIRERIVPTLDYQAKRRREATGRLRWAQARTRAAAAFTEWAHERGGLNGISRSAMDEWLTGPTSRYNVRDFVRWAIREHLLDLPLVSMPVRGARDAAEYVEEDERSQIARRLLHDATIDARDRLSGLLVVLYGQHLSRIAVLKTSQFKDDPARIRLGPDWLELPAPMDDIAREVVHQAGPEGWVFAGIRPGEHLSEEALGKRLTPLGIRARATRNAAVFHLAAALQPHTLYRLLGLHPTTAVRWGTVAGSVYMNYWASQLDDDDEDDFSIQMEDEDILVELGLDSPEEEFWTR